MSTEGTEGKELTLAPITPDDTDIKANAPTDTYDSSSGPNASASSDQSLDGWKLALVIIGAVCVVVASIYFVHKHHVRNAAANKRDRDSFEQRALESFFGQNRVTVPRETAVSSLNFVTDILTPRNGNAASTLFGKRSNTEMQMAVARSTAQGFHQSATSSIHRPTDNYHTNEFDPFTANESLITSSKTSPVIQSESEYFSTSSVSLGSIAPSILSSQGSLQPSIFDVGIRNTNLTDRSNSGFSVSLALSDSEIYRMSDQIPEGSVLRRGAPQLSASTKLRGYSSRNSDDFSIDESYVESFRTRLTQDNFSFFTTDSYETQTTQGIDDDDEDILSTTLSKNSEMSEGEI
ncbi:unnamed protein product [Peronospora belbahrii]|nr:unnamed protein product [Peronospora belbahrii]